MRSQTLHILTAAGLVFAGCMSNNVFLEYIVNKKYNEDAHPEGGALITVAQYWGVVVCALPFLLVSLPSGLIKLRARTTPWSEFLWHASMFIPMGVVNNFAFAFKVSQPLNVIFRSCGVVTTFLFGQLFFNKRYSLNEFFVVLVAAVGAAVSAWAHAGAPAASQPFDPAVLPSPIAGFFQGVSDDTVFYVGVGMLAFTVACSSLLTLTQSQTRARYGTATAESIFYTHLIAVIVLMCAWHHPFELDKAWAKWAHTPMVRDVVARWSEKPQGEAPAMLQWMNDAFPHWVDSLPECVAGMPHMLLALLLNVLTQVLCSIGVFRLISVADPLTVTFVMTLRRVATLLFSVYLFQNSFGLLHLLGATLVFSALLAYSFLQTHGPIEETPEDEEEFAREWQHVHRGQEVRAEASLSSPKATLGPSTEGTSQEEEEEETEEEQDKGEQEETEAQEDETEEQEEQGKEEQEEEQEETEAQEDETEEKEEQEEEDDTPPVRRRSTRRSASSNRRKSTRPSASTRRKTAKKGPAQREAELSELKVTELKEILRQQELKVSGKKAELISRILEGEGMSATA